MSSEITCKEALKLQFTPKSGMVTANILKTQESFRKWALSTIKSNLSLLKKEKYLCIGFRTRGTWEKHKIIAGVKIGAGKHYPGKCYYNLRE